MPDSASSTSSTSTGATGNARSWEDYMKIARQPKQNLGKNDFLTLLATQLQYQDPMEPQKDTSFVAQLAQFSSLEQLENLGNTITTQSYYNFVGKYVIAEGAENGVPFSAEGIVDRVITRNGETFVQIGDSIVRAKFVSQVYDKDLLTGGTNPLTGHAHILGKIVYGLVPGDTADAPPKEILGVVQSLTIEKGQIMANLADGTQIPVSNILGIREPVVAKEVEPEPEEPESGASDASDATAAGASGADPATEPGSGDDE